MTNKQIDDLRRAAAFFSTLRARRELDGMLDVTITLDEATASDLAVACSHAVVELAQPYPAAEAAE